MEIEVELFATLREYSPNPKGAFTLELKIGSTVADLLQRLDIPPEEIKQVMVNGRRAEPEQKLLPKQRVAVFPPLAGG